VLERLGRHTLSSLGYGLLTDGKDPLPFAFFPKLSCKLLHFACRLPLHSLQKELFNRAFRPRTKAGTQLAPLAVSG
jgi:hypothetical protein